VSAAENHRPRFAVIENVPEFVKWNLYPAWRLAMQALGYQLAPHIVDAADHGVPQHRERLFIVASRTDRPLMLRLPKRDAIPASRILDFDAGSWSPINKLGRAKATLDRIANGRRQHGDRFLMAYYGNEAGGRSMNRPLGTVTTRDRYALVDGDRMRMLTAQEYRAAMGFPAEYKLPDQHRLAVHMLGNAVCPPVACDIIEALKEAA
jgi:DNA (cytosine-5)-methyltransferase 1